MDFDPTEEQTLLGDMVEKFAEDRYGDGQRERYLRSPGGFDEGGWRIMAETGLLALPFSERLGGLNGAPGDIIAMMRPLGKRLAVEPVLGGPIIAGSLLERAGAPDQIETWAPELIAGAAHLALAHFEKAARFRLDYVDARYAEDAGAARINGSKTLVLAAGAADAFIASAIPASWAPNGLLRRDAVRFFLIKADAVGLTRRDYRLTDGSVACEIDLTNVVGEPMTGRFTNLEAVAARAKIAACAEMVGVMEMMFDATLDYVKTRRQFGRPIGAFQVVQHRMADLYTSLEFSRSHLHRIARADIDQAEDRRLIAGAKAFIAEAAMGLAEEAVQLHGAMGVTNELPIGDGLKRIMVLSTLFGDASAELGQFA